MSAHAWTVCGYMALLAAVLLLVAMLGVPSMRYEPQTEIELVKTVREVGMLAAGFAFGAGSTRLKA